ncbi:TRAP transporter, 4TM/12TM fusion protein [Halorubrum distributum JCM 9100]|uniref:TRAP transporter, 4TM/12TM fusion protein n=5 Tax=Halorubrum distributum TaxID=29283 RepID=M0EE94_9EURY|nr:MULTISPECIES: TRAP transporter fused permease subunit [Halorubrum distributum group]ELZ30816.1 TRAP transporter, 4TM/12TM fusion protein [Halorubrum terrestre JCM 10247]ELZ46040.1 TRAP transporter, 4TM/12TM fusion protein [Halorubrum distributum JCM 9100]ELZ50139.1 TRAP transporter, 4TM/12TM fusion protein [Halorubrum distributum JCM 10118]EMA71184.1 TRAP transporter, 4TM/12TM fusion protein [Halorubrum arcis JCM 13916]MYL17259.1 TRAP transporter fused permease subunit [Halorubrum terrestre
MATNPDTPTDPTDPPDDPVPEDSLLGDEEPLDLADGDRGSKQLWLYLLSLPFWVLVVFGPTVVAPALLGAEIDGSATIVGVVGVIGVAGIAGLILWLGSGIEERLRMALISYSIPFWMIVMWYSYTQQMPRGQYAVAFLGGILALYVISELDEPLIEGNWFETGLLVVSGLITLGTSGYLFLNYQQVAIDTVGRATEAQIAMAFAFTLAMIYLTWRSFGITFLAVVLIGIGYGLTGPYMPGALSHGGLSPSRILRILVVSVDGFYGFLTRLVAAWIALFLLYAGLLKAYGAFDLILRLAVRSAKYVDSGIAQTAVIASAVIGSVNGSQTANAGMTGSFTIPLMKENGIKPETAGGIEAVASTAGQVLPPVMGAGAFIMASLITGVTYVDVIIAGLIPAAVLVVSIAMAVHYVAAPQIDDPEMDGLINESMDRRTMVLESVKYGIPLLILIYVLGVLQYTVMTAALYTALSMIVFGIGIPQIQAALDGESNREALVDTLEQTVDGFREGVIVVAPVTIILAAINGVVDILMATGVPTAISLTLLDLSGGIAIVAFVLAMIICIILGLGMPTTAAYTVVALLVAPTLISQFAVPEFAAHFFVFYAAILAGLTPPIATCVAVTCGISGGGFWGSCKEALRISAPLFVLPFAFAYHPELVSGTFNYASLSAGALAMLGSIAIIHGINYQFVFGRGQTFGLRIAFFVAGVVAMVHPMQIVQVGALAAVLALYVLQTVIGRPNPLRTLRGAAGTLSGRKR